MDLWLGNLYNPNYLIQTEICIWSSYEEKWNLSWGYSSTLSFGHTFVCPKDKVLLCILGAKHKFRLLRTRTPFHIQNGPFCSKNDLHVLDILHAL